MTRTHRTTAVRNRGDRCVALRLCGVGVTALLATTSCNFQYDRALNPGDIRGQVFIQGVAGTAPVPVAGARIALENSSVSVLTDARGSFVISSLPAGTYALDATARSAGTLLGLRLENLVLQSLSTAKETGLDLGQITIGATGGLAGSVTRTQQPLTGAEVAIPNFGSQTTTRAGAYTFLSFFPGTYSIGAFYVTENGSLELPPRPVTVVARTVTQVPPLDFSSVVPATPGGVQGQVRLQGGAPADSVTVSLAGYPTPIRTVDGNGDYSASGIPPGIYTLAASRAGYLTAVVTGVFVAGAPTQVPTITLARSSSVEVDGGSTGTPSEQLSQPGGAATSSPNFAAVSTTTNPAPVQQSTNYVFIPGSFARLVGADGGTP
jgi:hypothetical protein